MVREHKLKIKSDYLQNILSGNKKAEIRFNDRDYQVGDTVFLYDIAKLGPLQKIQNHSVYDACFTISHIHSGLGMAENYVVLSFKKLNH